MTSYMIRDFNVFERTFNIAPIRIVISTAYYAQKSPQSPIPSHFEGLAKVQCPGRFLGSITGRYPSVCKFNRLHVDILRFSLQNWGIFYKFL